MLWKTQRPRISSDKLLFIRSPEEFRKYKFCDQHDDTLTSDAGHVSTCYNNDDNVYNINQGKNILSVSVKPSVSSQLSDQ